MSTGLSRYHPALDRPLRKRWDSSRSGTRSESPSGSRSWCTRPRRNSMFGGGPRSAAGLASAVRP